MKISEFLQELKRRNKPLYYFGWANFWLFVFCVIMFFADDTVIKGINAWIKPMKFAITVTLYMWTFAWLLNYVISERKRNFITWGIIVCMFVENFIITLQAYRGETSHYNTSTPLNAMLFSTMGTFIALNTFLNLYALVLFFFHSQVNLVGNMLIAWRAGLLLFFLGGISGGLMLSHMSHTFGAADGGAGLPFVNWSTMAGDVRSAHFITLHGLQAIPLFAWFIAERTHRPALSTILFFVFYSVMCIALHLIALSGRPLISM